MRERKGVGQRRDVNPGEAFPARGLQFTSLFTCMCRRKKKKKGGGREKKIKSTKRRRNSTTLSISQLRRSTRLHRSPRLSRRGKKGKEKRERKRAGGTREGENIDWRSSLNLWSGSKLLLSSLLQVWREEKEGGKERREGGGVGIGHQSARSESPLFRLY